MMTLISLSQNWPRVVRRGVCLLLCGAIPFTQTGLVWAGTGAFAEHPEAPVLNPSLAAEEAAVPPALGEIQERWTGTSAKTVIILQDAHTVYDAQKSIEGLIRFFYEQAGVDLIGVEGGSGPLDPVVLEAYPDKDYRASVLDHYLREGELSGAVTAAVSLEGKAHFAGLESKRLYEKNLEAYQEASGLEARNQAWLDFAERGLESLKERDYAGEFLAFDRQEKIFWNGKNPDLFSYLQGLFARKKPEGYPLLLAVEKQLLSARSVPGLDEKNEFDRLADWILSQPLAQEDERKVNRAIQAYRTSETDLVSSAGVLMPLAKSHGLEAGRFPALEKLTIHAPLLLTLKGPSFISELKRFSAEIRSGFLVNDRVKDLNKISQSLDLLRRLNQLELTPDEWRYYQNERELNNPEAVFRKLSAAGVEPFTGPEEGAFRPAEIFYEAAEARDFVFRQKILDLMEESQKKNFLFLAGGFHSSGLTGLFREAGVSYILVSPRVAKVPEESFYDRAMKGDVSWKRFFQEDGGQVDLEAAFTRGAVRQLVQSSWGDRREEKIREWRRELVRRLSVERDPGRLQKLTRYLDELTEEDAGESKEMKAEVLLQKLSGLFSNGRFSRENVLRLAAAASAMPYTNINIGTVPAFFLTGRPELDSGRSELRSEVPELGSFLGITEKMPVIDFLAAFGIDAASAVITPVKDLPDFGRVPVAESLDTLESAASVFLSENTRRQAKVYVKAVEEGDLEALRRLYLLTYHRRPAALVWALPALAGEGPYVAHKTLIYPLLDYQQSALFTQSPSSGELPPFLNRREAMAFYDKVIEPYIRRAHGTIGYLNNFNILEDPYHESPQSAMNVRSWDDMKSGFAFPGSYGPWEHSTQFLVDMLEAHLLKKTGGTDLQGLHLVDVGSGAGRVAVYLAQKGARVQAYDLTQMKAMNTQAWARINGVLDRVHAEKAFSVKALTGADGYIVNFPNLDEKAKRLDEMALMKYEDSRQVNVSMHPDDFRQVMQDLRDAANPGAFLFIRGNYTDRGLELFEPIMRETGWTEGLDQPLEVPDGVEPFGAAYFLRQGSVRSELRSPGVSNSERARERDLNTREKYERILREANFGRHLEELLNNLMDALERPEAERILIWREVPGTALDQLVNALRSANSHYRLLSPGSLKADDYVMVLEVPGVGLEGLGQKELNGLLGEEKVNRLIELRRQALHEVLNETRLYDFGEEVLYSTYKEDVLRIRLFQPSEQFPESGKWSGPGGIEALAEELRRRMIEEVTQALRDQAGPYRPLLESASSRAALAKKGITDLDRQPLFELNFGISQVSKNSAAARLNADINAHQALTIAALSSGQVSRVFRTSLYREKIYEMAKLRQKLSLEAREGPPVLEEHDGFWTLRTPAAEILRKRYGWSVLSSTQQQMFSNDPDYYAAAQRYFDLLRLQDYIKKWDVDFGRAVKEATRIRKLVSKLEHYRSVVQILYGEEHIEDFAGSDTIVKDRDKLLLQKLPALLLNDSRRRSLASPRWFHAVVPSMVNPVYVNLDVKGMGIMNVNSFETEIQAVEKELRSNGGNINAEVEQIWRSSADSVTESVQGIEPILRELVIRAYREARIEAPADFPVMMGGDEVVFALDGDFFKGERLDSLLFTLRDEIKKHLALEIRAGVSQRIQDYRKHFEGHKSQADVAHASLMLGMDEITALLKRLELLEAQGQLDPSRRQAILYHVPGADPLSWVGKTKDELRGIVSFNALEAAELGPRSELRETLEAGPFTVPSALPEQKTQAQTLARALIAAIQRGEPLQKPLEDLVVLFSSSDDAPDLWRAFESAYKSRLAVSAEFQGLENLPEGARKALHDFAAGPRLFSSLKRLAQQRDFEEVPLADFPELPVSFAVGENLVYQAALTRRAGESEEGVKALLKTSLENEGRFIFATRAGSPSGEAAASALDQAIRELGGEIRSDRVNRLQTGAAASLDQFEAKLGKDGDLNRFVVFVETGDAQVNVETPGQKRRALVFVLDPEVLSLLSVSEIMRILKNLALVPEELREFYRDELGLSPDPKTGRTLIGRNFLHRLQDLARAEAQLLTSA